MPQATATGLVLGSLLFNEQDKLVFILTANRGIIKAIAPGAAKAKNRFGSMLELFTTGTFHYYWNEGKELVTLSKGEIIQSFFNTVSLPNHVFYFYLMAEIVMKFTPAISRENRLFSLLQSVLKSSQENHPIGFLLLYFLVWILRLEGLMFNPDLCHNCYKKGIQKAWIRDDFRGILCSDCQGGEKNSLKRDDLLFLKWVLTHPPKPAADWQKTIDPKKLTKIFLTKIEYHMETTLKTHSYIKEFN